MQHTPQFRPNGTVVRRGDNDHVSVKRGRITTSDSPKKIANLHPESEVRVGLWDEQKQRYFNFYLTRTDLWDLGKTIDTYLAETGE